MLDYALTRTIEALKIPDRAVLATNGPAGVLASEFHCEAEGLRLYLLVPKSSDHLFNLEHDSSVSLVTTIWELKAEARVLPNKLPGLELNIFKDPDIEKYALVQINPKRLQFRRSIGWGNIETIDFQ